MMSLLRLEQALKNNEAQKRLHMIMAILLDKKATILQI